MDRKHAIEALHRKYAGVLFNLCCRLLGDRSEAEDAVQEVFLSAYRAYDSFTYGESHLPWLYRIASNTCFKFIRTRRRKGLTLTENLDRNADTFRHPADAMYSRQVLERIATDLDERGFEILVSYYLTGMDLEEIAKVLGISRRAVVKRLHHLRNRVGRLLEEA